MPAARGAHHFGSDHPVRRVRVLVDRALARRSGEGGPPAARVVLRFRAEELGAAAGAAVRSVVERVVVLAAERPLRALLAEDAELLGRQLLPPLLFGFSDFSHTLWSRKRRKRYFRGPWRPWTRSPRWRQFSLRSFSERRPPLRPSWRVRTEAASSS